MPSLIPRKYAFPMPNQGSIPGMLLRDYYATQALAGFLANPNTKLQDNDEIRAIAEFSYDVADAMMQARGNPPQDEQSS